MSVLHGAFTEHVLATEDTWMGGRGQPHETASEADLPKALGPGAPGPSRQPHTTQSRAAASVWTQHLSSSSFLGSAGGVTMSPGHISTVLLGQAGSPQAHECLENPAGTVAPGAKGNDHIKGYASVLLSVVSLPEHLTPGSRVEVKSRPRSLWRTHTRRPGGGEEREGHHKPNIIRTVSRL